MLASVVERIQYTHDVVPIGLSCHLRRWQLDAFASRVSGSATMSGAASAGLTTSISHRSGNVPSTGSVEFERWIRDLGSRKLEKTTGEL